MIRVTIDFETANTVGIDLTVVGAEVYAAHWATEIICLAEWQRGFRQPEIWTPNCDDRSFRVFATNPDVIWDAHGAGFEQAIWRHIMVKRYGFPEIPIERWDDTMAVAALKQMPLALEKCVKALDLENQKDMKGNALTKKLSKPNKQGYFDRSPETLEKVYAYCRQDVAVEAELRRRLGNLSSYERPTWELDQRINARGVRLDQVLIEQALACVDKATVPLTAEFKTLTGGLAPGQVGKLNEWLATQGVVLDDLRKETLAALLGDDDVEGANTPGEYNDAALPSGMSGCDTISKPVRRVLAIRQMLGSASIKKLKRTLQCVGNDGRSRGLLQYHGTGPGRKAGRLWQPQNLPWDKGGNTSTLAAVEMVKEGTATIKEVGFALMGCIIPDPGKLFFVGDFTGSQARIVLALAGQWDKVQLLLEGQDIYLDFAHAMYHKPPGTYTKADKGFRQKGKGGVLGCGFQCGYDKFNTQFLGGKIGDIEMIDYEPVIQWWATGDPETAILTIDTYRKEWAPLVPNLWKGLESAALAAVQDRGSIQRYACVEYQVVDWWLECRMPPDGHVMYYFDPKVGVGKFGKPAWSYMKGAHDAEGNAGRVDAYGGLLTENVVMAIERALMVDAQFRLEEAGFPVVLDGHDEIVCESANADWRLPEFREIMAQSPAWAEKLGIPIAVEAWCGDRYRK